MNERIPKHAELPLWPEKSIDQKEEVLNSMISDLNWYLFDKGLPETSLNYQKEIDPDLFLEKLLSEYEEILGEDRAKILFLLESAIPYDNVEEKDINIIKGLILNNANILNMNSEVGHVTGSALVLHRDTKRVLLHKHKKLGVWLQFGGHPDFETSVVDIAIRETVEESGLSDLKLVSVYANLEIPIDVELQTIAEKKERPKHFHADFRYFLETTEPDLISASDDESDNFWWVDAQAALNEPDSVITPPVKRLIKKAISYFDN